MLSYDDYIEYVNSCKKLGVTPVSIKDDFYKHWEEIDKENKLIKAKRAIN